MDKKKKVNRGLQEIFGENIASVIDQINDVENSSSTEIEIEKISVNPYQPRKVFNEKKISELSDSIKRNGLIQPIVLKKYDDDRYYVISGERRLRACKLAGMSKIPSRIIEITDKQMQEISIIENIQRENLNPYEEALSYKRIIDVQGITQSELAKSLSKSRSYIANIIRLLNLPQEVLNLLYEEKLSIGQVRPLIVLSETDAINVANRALKENLNSREIESIVKSYTNKTYNTQEILVDPYIIETQGLLSKKFGTKVKIEKNKIVINVTSKEEMRDILDQLLKD